MDLCRTCLSCTDLNPIFFPGAEERISKDLEITTGIIIKPNDGYPQKICKKCILALNTALQFRKCSHKVHEALLELKLPNVKPQTHKIETIDDEEDGEGYPVEFIDDWEVNDNSKEHQVNDDKVVKEVNVKKPEKKKVVKNYKCELCKKELKGASSFRLHKRAHYISVVCEECGYKCRNDHVLMAHKRAKHNVAKIHKCQHCDYESSNKDSLKIHLRLHTGEKPYECATCGATFHRRSCIIQHIATHVPESEKKFKCPLCPRLFASPSFVRTHTYASHKEKSFFYTCMECPSVFKKTCSARKHMLKQHGITMEQQGKLGRIPKKDYEFTKKNGGVTLSVGRPITID